MSEINFRAHTFTGKREIKMAVQSMTGYGKAEVVGEGYTATVELKSVNNRFLEFQIRTSKNILALESGGAFLEGTVLGV